MKNNFKQGDLVTINNISPDSDINHNWMKNYINVIGKVLYEKNSIFKVIWEDGDIYSYAPDDILHYVDDSINIYVSGKLREKCLENIK